MILGKRGGGIGQELRRNEYEERNDPLPKFG